MREAWEEVALDPADVELIGELDHLSTVVSRSYIVPLVARLPGPLPLAAASPEVERVLWLPLAELVRPDTYRSERWGRAPTDRLLHFFELDDETIWGATAHMLVDLLSRLDPGPDGAEPSRPKTSDRVRPGTGGAPTRPATWRHSVVEVPIEKRSTGAPSSTVRVNSTRPWRWLARSASSVSPSTKRRHSEVQRVRGDDLEPLVGTHLRRQPLRQLDMAADHRLDRLDPVEADRQPQLERPEPPPERDLPIPVVDRRTRLGGRRAEVLRQDAQRAEQRGPVGRPVQVAVEVDPHPLVRVRAVAVGELQSVR